MTNENAFEALMNRRRAVSLQEVLADHDLWSELPALVPEQAERLALVGAHGVDRFRLVRCRRCAATMGVGYRPTAQPGIDHPVGSERLWAPGGRWAGGEMFLGTKATAPSSGIDDTWTLVRARMKKLGWGRVPQDQAYWVALRWPGHPAQLPLWCGNHGDLRVGSADVLSAGQETMRV